MKKLLLVLFISACTFSVNYSITPVRPNEYGLGEELSGKLFKISCDSTSYSSSYVDEECKVYMSQLAHKYGYDYFSVIDEKADTQQSTHSYRTNEKITTRQRRHDGTYIDIITYVPTTKHHTVVNNSQYYYFVLITPEEVSNWNNYYKVQDYFPEGYE